MSKVMLINVTHAEESRVGIIADGVLESFEIESFSREHLKGNIYKGIVHRIHPALEAAFVDIGAERDAFLPLDEICFRNMPNISREGGNGHESRRRLRIKEVLKPGEEVLVQIVKEEFGNKPPTLSTFYSLPGRSLVLLPGSEDAGISRKIEGAERSRIREVVEELHPPAGFGIIIRTAAGFDEGDETELQRDLNYLLRLWESIQQGAATKRAPALVYREHDLVLRNIRDYFTPDIDEIHIDNDEVFQRARDFLRDVMPGKENVLHLYQGDKPIFSHFNVESQIESIYKRRVPLKSGGSIVIDGTEALTAIDVNSGRSVRGSSQEDTAFRTNLEAATEIARQLRLRDVGGLIVIDFIDMRGNHHVTEVERTYRDAMRPDKARHEIGRISNFGLLEVSRQRLRPAAAATSYTACPMCEGHGLVRTTESAALVALRKIHNRVAQGDAASLRVQLPPEVAVYLLNQKRDDLAQLERRYATRIQIALNAELMPHQSELEVRSRLEAGQAKLPQIRLGGVTPDEPVAADAGANGSAPAAAATSEAAAAPAKRKRRRRGRRRGRGRQAAAALGEALAALGGAAPAAETTAADEGDSAADAAEQLSVAERVPEATEAESSAAEIEERAEAEADLAELASSDAIVTAVAGAGTMPVSETADAASAPTPGRSRRARGGAKRRGGRRRAKTTTTKAAPAVEPAAESSQAAAKKPAARRRSGASRKSTQRRRRTPKTQAAVTPKPES